MTKRLVALGLGFWLIVAPSIILAEESAVPFTRLTPIEPLSLQEAQKLAKKGDADAQYELAKMHADGAEVPRDNAEAARLYHLSALQGHVAAQFALGAMYLYSRGVPQDYAKAHMWFNIARANGHARAGTFRHDMEKFMTGSGISEAQRRAGVCMESGYQDCD